MLPWHHCTRTSCSAIDRLKAWKENDKQNIQISETWTVCGIWGT